MHLLLYDGTYWRLMDSFLSAFGGTVRGSISPSSSSYSLGSSTSRWYNVHTTNLTVNGSSMDDFVTEQGTSGIWTYRKWKSGVAELWGGSGSLTASGSGVTLSLPFAIKNFNGVASPGYNTGSNLKTVYTVGLSGNNQTGSSSIELWAVDSSTGGTPTYSIYAQMYITGTLV